MADPRRRPRYVDPPYTGRRTGDGGTGNIPEYSADPAHGSGDGLFSLVKIEWMERDGRGVWWLG